MNERPVDEHDFEPVRGLPEPLPPGESIVWQGSPDWRGMARRAYHLPPLALYFALLIGWQGLHGWLTNEPWQQLLPSVVILATLAFFALVIVALLAWLAARTAVYTITTRRIVMRIGIVLSISFNLPFTVIAAAGLRRYADGTGDITLTLTRGNKIAWLHLWPHTRPWRVKQPEPMLRAIPAAGDVAALLAKAVAATPGTTPAPTAAGAGTVGSSRAALATVR